jgi:hypothetical protein
MATGHLFALEAPTGPGESLPIFEAAIGHLSQERSVG